MKKINEIIKRIDAVVNFIIAFCLARLKRADQAVTKTFKFWGRIPARVKWICFWLSIPYILIAIVTLLAILWDILLGLRNLYVFVIMHQNEISSIFWLLVFLALIFNEVRRHGLVRTALLSVILLIVLKYVTTLTGNDSRFIDGALNSIADVPRVVSEELIPWIADTLVKLSAR